MAKDEKKPETKQPSTNEPTQTLAEMGGLKTQLFGTPPPPVSPEALEVRELAEKKIRTSGTFVLTQRYFDNASSRMFEPGELVTIDNEVPGRTWVRYVPPAAGPVATPVKPSGSAVEKDI